MLVFDVFALDQNPNTKDEIMDYINKEDDVVDLEIDDWLTMDSWGNTPAVEEMIPTCLLYTSPSPRDKRQSRMPSSA